LQFVSIVWGAQLTNNQSLLMIHVASYQ
jgi:hypothetical protein